MHLKTKKYNTKSSLNNCYSDKNKSSQIQVDSRVVTKRYNNILLNKIMIIKVKWEQLLQVLINKVKINLLNQNIKVSINKNKYKAMFEHKNLIREARELKKK